MSYTIQRKGSLSTTRRASSLLYFLHTIYLFSYDDYDIFALILLFGMLNASVAGQFSMGAPLSIIEILIYTPRMALWSWANLFLFHLHNQRHPQSIAEDRMNKPWRPIPSGRLTPQQATHLIYGMYPVVLFVGLMAGGRVPCFLQTVFSFWYNEWRGSSNAFSKNFHGSIGLAFLMAGPLEVATGHSVFSDQKKAAIWLFVLTASMVNTIHIQDFRDKEGDKASGRDTLPLLIGDMNARVVVVLGILGWSITATFFWEAGWRESTPCCVAGATTIIALLQSKTRDGDALAYRLWYFWLAGLVMLPYLSARS